MAPLRPRRAGLRPSPSSLRWDDRLFVSRRMCKSSFCIRSRPPRIMAAMESPSPHGGCMHRCRSGPRPRRSTPAATAVPGRHCRGVIGRARGKDVPEPETGGCARPLRRGPCERVASGQRADVREDAQGSRPSIGYPRRPGVDLSCVERIGIRSFRSSLRRKKIFSKKLCYRMHTRCRAEWVTWSKPSTGAAS